MKTLSLKLPDALAAKVEAMARKRHTSKSALIREALESYLSDDRKKPFLTLLDVAPDVIGCVSGGPGDLSTNKKHMEGFGR
jgi:Arc/MetJ-type ribon-helix-helix transcriptional regulator